MNTYWNTQKVFSLWIISLYPQMSLSQMRSDAFFKGAENWKKCAQLSVASSLQAHRCSISFALQYRTDLWYTTLSVNVIVKGAVSRSALCQFIHSTNPHQNGLLQLQVSLFPSHCLKTVWTTTLHHLIDSVSYWLDANFSPWGPLLKLARFPAPKSCHLVLQEQLLPSLWSLELNRLFNLLMHFKTSIYKCSQLWIWQYSEVSQCHSLGWAKCQVTE